VEGAAIPTPLNLVVADFGAKYGLSWAVTYPHPETRRMLLKLYRSVNPQDFVGREERLHHLTAHVPTLVLWGDTDPFLAPAYVEQVGSAHVEQYPQNGHWLAIESPGIVAQRLAPLKGSIMRRRQEIRGKGCWRFLGSV
jgi:pimeloyl-ACP methyl ester carboxylesterase